MFYQHSFLVGQRLVSASSSGNSFLPFLSFRSVQIELPLAGPLDSIFLTSYSNSLTLFFNFFFSKSRFFSSSIFICFSKSSFSSDSMFSILQSNIHWPLYLLAFQFQISNTIIALTNDSLLFFF